MPVITRAGLRNQGRHDNVNCGPASLSEYMLCFFLGRLECSLSRFKLTVLQSTRLYSTKFWGKPLALCRSAFFPFSDSITSSSFYDS